MRWILNIVLVGLFVACGSVDAPSTDEAQGESAAAEESAKPQYFQAHGVIEAIDIEMNSVTIAHEDIPGFMNAMTMEFEVMDPAQLDTVSEGEEVDFVVMVNPDGSYVLERFGEMPR